jgi:hypothetical protein
MMVVSDFVSLFRLCRRANAQSKSVVVAGVNPHRLRFPGAFKAALAVEIDRTSIRDQHVLVKACVAMHEHPHQSCANSPAAHPEFRYIEWRLSSSVQE